MYIDTHAQKAGYYVEKSTLVTHWNVFSLDGWATAGQLMPQQEKSALMVPATVALPTSMMGCLLILDLFLYISYLHSAS